MGLIEGTSKWRSFVNGERLVLCDHRARCLENTSTSHSVGDRTESCVAIINAGLGSSLIGSDSVDGNKLDLPLIDVVVGGESIRHGNDHPKAADHSDWRDMTSLTSQCLWLPLRLRTKVAECDMTSEITDICKFAGSAHTSALHLHMGHSNNEREHLKGLCVQGQHSLLSPQQDDFTSSA